MMSQPAPQRFSDRVADYVRYRPSYPAAAVDTLIERCGLAPGDRVADVGSGTGILTALLLDCGLHVVAIEPNEPMREAAEQGLADRARFTSHAGTAEATGLPDADVKAVTAAQAFHWFNPKQARRELARILEPGGHVALLWNDRHTDSTPFLRDYEQLLQTYGTDYQQVNHKRVDAEQLAAFFGHDSFTTDRFANQQVFDHAGLEGRVRSSSYVPGPGHPNHAPMLAELRRIFDRHQRNGQVVFEYDTLLYCGRLGADLTK